MSARPPSLSSISHFTQGQRFQLMLLAHERMIGRLKRNVIILQEKKSFSPFFTPEGEKIWKRYLDKNVVKDRDDQEAVTLFKQGLGI